MNGVGAYLYRMGKCTQFRRIGIQPQWVPGAGDIDGFIHDEVVRQYHDPSVEHDGAIRITWMKNAWEYAQGQATYGPPTVETMLRVAGHVEPGKNKNGFREHDVQVGDRLCPNFVLVPRLVETLFSTVDQVVPKQGRSGFYENSYDSDVPTADDFYLEFERIHPFGDGNGRTGKILHNWLLGTLDEPVLVDDYFGGGNP